MATNVPWGGAGVAVGSGVGEGVGGGVEVGVGVRVGAVVWVGGGVDVGTGVTVEMAVGRGVGIEEGVEVGAGVGVRVAVGIGGGVDVGSDPPQAARSTALNATMKGHDKTLCMTTIIAHCEFKGHLNLLLRRERRKLPACSPASGEDKLWLVEWYSNEGPCLGQQRDT